MGRSKSPRNFSPEFEARAAAFLAWCGDNAGRLRRYIAGGGVGYDEDVFQDALLRAYDAIGRRGTEVHDKTGYFLRVYRSAFLDTRKRPGRELSDESALVRVAALEYDTEAALAADRLDRDILDYVRTHYDEAAVSLFEIYRGLQPDISYKRMSVMLGIPATRIWPVIGQIKKDLAIRFAEARRNLRSMD